jgi:hypothetical protein
MSQEQVASPKQIFWEPLYWNDLLGITIADEPLPIPIPMPIDNQKKEYRALIVPQAPAPSPLQLEKREKKEKRAAKVPVPEHKKDKKYRVYRQKNTQTAKRSRETCKELDRLSEMRLQMALDRKKTLDEEKKALLKEMDNYRVLFRLLGLNKKKV